MRNIQPIGDFVDQLIAAAQHRQELGLQEAGRVHEAMLDFGTALRRRRCLRGHCTAAPASSISMCSELVAVVEGVCILVYIMPEHVVQYNIGSLYIRPCIYSETHNRFKVNRLH